MFVSPLSTSFVVLPVSFIDITVNMRKFSFVNGVLPLPLALPSCQSP
jgi:hypothetical protein